jgi:hypothetical protein
MGAKNISYDNLLDDLLVAIGSEAEPDPADGWVKLTDMIVKAKTEQGLSDPQIRGLVDKQYAAGKLERRKFGLHVYYRVKPVV